MAGKRSGNAAALALLFCSLFLLYITFPFDAVLKRPASLVVTDRSGFAMRGTLSTDGEWRLPIPYEEMGKWMPAVVVALEDRRFWTHSGVDLPAIFRAVLQNRDEGRIVSGGSTITSQVIRLSIDRDRTPINKAKEFWQASVLELFQTKREILETYLNITPYGGNIRGVEAASLTWFGKHAKDISLAEAALLAGILRGPSVYRPDRHPERARELRDRLIDTLLERGVATDEEARRAKQEPLPSEKRALPAYFMQAASRAARTSDVWRMTDRYGRLRSTIEMEKQYALQTELSNTLAAMDPGITGAAVLVENETGAVRGYIGNAKEGWNIDAAWVDCASSPRSPGSTLKPFVYALAFESGELTPASMLADAGSGDGPRNFDRMFRGPVSARTALADSLNVPAVRVFRMQGGRKTLDLYRRLSFSHFRKDADWYGDSLVLGGCEVTALELARAYRTLANRGVDTPLVWAEGAEAEHKTQVLSEESSALALDVLKDTRRLLPLYNEIFGEDGTVIAFKTGTSYGRRDAWTAAVTSKYTLVVWYGDPAGRPHYPLVGINTAAPSAIRILRKITPQGTKWFDLPKGVARGPVCPLSGALRNQWCPQSIEELYIEKISRREPCKLHAFEKGSIVIKWPPELENYFKRDDAPQGSQRRLRITSILPNASYLMRTEKERLELAAAGGGGELFWFVDGEYFDSSGPARERPVFWPMSEGTHRITAADERGAEMSVTFRVRKSGAIRSDEDLPILEETP